MRRVPSICLAALLAVAAPTAPAQEGDAADIEEGVDLLSEGARRVLRGLMGKVEPRMRDFARALEEWNFDGIGIDDLGAYHPPEVLPNGDIIIRRKRPIPPEGEIEL